MTATTPFAENFRGIVALTACNFLFLINDTLIKLVSDDLPLGQIMFLRGLFATTALIPLVHLSGALAQTELLFNRTVLWRTIAEMAAAILFLTALFNIPIANANAILQVVPLLITAAGAIFLGEIVGWRRWIAILAGFAGVIIIVRPGLEGFTVYSLVAVGAAFATTLRDLTTRVMPRALPAVLVSVVTASAVGCAGIAIAVVTGETWQVPTFRHLATIALAVTFLIGGYLTAIEFMRHGDISVVAPFRYTVIVMAMIVGFIVWGDVPDTLMIVGTVIIAGAGIYTFSRERNLARLREEAASGEGL